MKKLILLFSGLLLLTLLSSTAVFAFELKSGDSVVIDQEVMDDLYLLSGSASIDAPILGDLHVMGGQVTINDNISEDLVVAGGRVVVMGNVEGDIRILGGQVAIYGSVGEDVLVLGGQIDIGQDSVISGSVLAGSGYLSIEGTVMEEVRGGTGMFILNGVVEGDVTMTVEDTINISDEARIGGDLNYTAILETEFPKSVIGGQVNYNQSTPRESVEDIDTTAAFFAFKIVSYVSALIIAFLFVVFAPRLVEKSAKLTSENIIKSFAVGVLTMILAFIGSLILMMTLVGIPIALIISAALVIIFYISKVFVAIWLAGYIVNFRKKKNLKVKMFFAIMLTLFMYYLLSAVPYLGWLINMILFLIGAGTIMLLKQEYLVFLKSKKML